MTITKAKTTDFLPDKNNANRGSVRGAAMIDSSLREDGAARSIVVDADNNIVAGNKTLQSAVEIGIKDAIVVDTTGNELVVVRRKDWHLYEQEAPRRYAYRDNRAGEVSLDWDALQIAADLEAGLDLSGLWDDTELAAILEAAGTELLGGNGKAPEPQVDKAAELAAEYGTNLGQLWQLGKHRLIIGDCTDRAVVEAVMMGERAEMMFTDPPYGVAVGDKNRFLNSIARSNRIEENLTNDDIDEVALVKMLSGAFDNAASVCLAGGAWYVAAPPGPLHVLFGQELKKRGIWRQTIQWVKNNATFSPMGVDYHWQAEPIFYGWLPGAGHRYYGGRKQTTVWEIARPLKSPEHPTMKPVELVTRAVSNSSKRDEVVVDFFLGSGTTLIAAEQLGRRCFGIEIDKGYAAVSIHRWHQLTGLQPQLVSG